MKKKRKLFATRRWNVLLLAPRKFLLRKWILTFAFIKGTDSEEFKRITSLLNAVLIMSAGYYRGFITSRGILVHSAGFAEKNYFGMNKIIWQASSLIHEVYHLRQFRAGWWQRLSQERLEENAYGVQIRYLLRLDQHEKAEHLQEQLCESDKWWNIDSPEVKKECNELMDFYKRVIEGEFDIEYISNKNFRS